MDDSLRTVGSPDRTSLPSRTLVIGLSGCSWNVLEPLLDSGDLPHLSAMRDRGMSGTLESVIPFQPAPAWASYATGAPPGTHGCFDHVAPEPDGRMRILRGGDLRCPTYYEQLGREGRRSVLVNLPIDQTGCEGAVIVNSWLTLDESRRIYPIGRRERYRRLLEAQRVVPADPRSLDDICQVDEARFDLVRELCLAEDWDHFFVLFSATDWLGHMGTGRFVKGNDDARRAFLRLYRQLDAHIGWLLDHASDATAFVISEHGQAEERAILRVNTVLERLGLAETLPYASRDLPAGTKTVPSALSRYRGNALVRPFARATKSAARSLLGVQLVSASLQVDTRCSDAFSPTDASCAVYVRDESELDAIVAALEAVTLPDGGRAIESIWRTEALWGRPPRADEPALLYEPAIGVRPSAAVKDRAVDFPSSRGLGCHQRDGVLLIAGPDVAYGDLDRISICDLAPTLLWLMDAPLPSQAEGRVIREAFTPAAVRPVRLAGRNGNGKTDSINGNGTNGMANHEPTSGVHDLVTRRLKALGYI